MNMDEFKFFDLLNVFTDWLLSDTTARMLEDEWGSVAFTNI